MSWTRYASKICLMILVFMSRITLCIRGEKSWDALPIVLPTIRTAKHAVVTFPSLCFGKISPQRYKRVPALNRYRRRDEGPKRKAGNTGVVGTYGEGLYAVVLSSKNSNFAAHPGDPGHRAQHRRRASTRMLVGGPQPTVSRSLEYPPYLMRVIAPGLDKDEQTRQHRKLEQNFESELLREGEYTGSANFTGKFLRCSVATDGVFASLLPRRLGYVTAVRQELHGVVVGASE